MAKNHPLGNHRPCDKYERGTRTFFSFSTVICCLCLWFGIAGKNAQKIFFLFAWNIIDIANDKIWSRCEDRLFVEIHEMTQQCFKFLVQRTTDPHFECEFRRLRYLILYLKSIGGILISLGHSRRICNPNLIDGTWPDQSSN